MKNTFFNFACRRCGSTVSKWTRLLPTNVHTYRVTCSRCDCFVGWGNERQLQQLIRSDRSIETAIAVVEPPGATLDDYL